LGELPSLEVLTRYLGDYPPIEFSLLDWGFGFLERKTAPVEECLPTNCEALSSSPCTAPPKKKKERKKKQYQRE
jgi:hypothetical protein